MYNELRKVMVVVHGRAHLVGKVSGKGETVIYFTRLHGKAIQDISYFSKLELDWAN